jgi:hypothetical protein
VHHLKILPLLTLIAACSAPDKTQFQKWQAKTENRTKSGALRSYLEQQGVSDVIPLYQLLRSDTQWRRCGAEPFTVPPRTMWPHIVPTLYLIKKEIIPIIGPVEALSVFRTSEINRCIKGAGRSYHLGFYAIDMKPVKKVKRAQLVQKLCDIHRAKGKQLNMGLGIYNGTRFHIDTAGYRGWGSDHKGTSFPCRIPAN